MRLSKLLGNRYKEWPADVVSKSHGILLKGGYIRQVAGGIYSFLPLAQKVAQKITNIIKEEMDGIGFEQVLMPVVAPKELWEESGRYETISEELVRFEDRNEHKMVLCMTHEEAAVQLVRTEATTYSKYPVEIYQVQTKFRDEARPRGGLIRTREFLMKDGYSFHTTQESLDECYSRCYEAYFRIFKRVGLTNFIAVESDTGMMGGTGAHEFMLLCEIGEDSLAICPNCNYSANLEVAEGILDEVKAAPAEQPEEIDTPGVKTIEELEQFVRLPKSRLIKACVFNARGKAKPVVVFIRGDLEVNEAKLRRALGTEVEPRTAAQEDGLCYGFIGPWGLAPEEFELIYDVSLAGASGMVCGANKPGKHMVGVDIEALNVAGFEDVYKASVGMTCPACRKAKLEIKRGVEIGNIFKLGDKYTKSMNMTYVDADGKEKHPIMGCYGIGVGRLLASVIEEHNDENGPIWPAATAPFLVQIVAINYSDENVKRCAEQIYAELLPNCDVLLDDRDLSAGVQFAEADLIGAPVRVIVSKKGIAQGEVEVVTRTKSACERVKPDQVEETVAKFLKEPFLRGEK